MKPTAVYVRDLPENQQVSVGDTLYYVPRHAKGNLEHRDVEAGTVTSITPSFIFVKFNASAHGLACRRSMLMKMIDV